jgi:hypothetical protein
MVECPGITYNKLLGVSKLRVVVHLNNVELGCSLSESFCHAPSVKDVVVLLVYVVLDSIQLVAWSVVSGGI